MVVVVIIGILVAVAIPLYGSVTRNAANRAHEANIRTLVGAANMHIADVTLAVAAAQEPGPLQTALEAYVETWPTVPNDAHGPVTNLPSTVVSGDADSTKNGQTYTVGIASSGQITVNISQ